MLLEVHSVTKSYPVSDGRLTVLDNIDLSVGEREIVGLVGESGGGKSTLSNIIAGLEVADSGKVLLDGKNLEVDLPINKRSDASRTARLNLAMVFQQPIASFSERMKIGNGIREGLVYHEGYDRKTAMDKVYAAMDMVGLPRKHADKYAWELSGGECQRAAIARAIISRPQLLICDEPTSALDVTVQALIVNLLVDLCHDVPMACLFVSHDLALVKSLCSRLYVLDHGTFVEQGNADDVFSNPHSESFKRLLSSIPEL